MNNKMTSTIPVLFCICLLGQAMLTSGCAKTVRARKVTKSGFLDDYSQLKPTKGNELAQLLYIDFDTDWHAYSNIYIEPITIWTAKGNDMEGVDKGDLQKLADFFYAALVEQLEKDYNLVQGPGPGTLRIRFALTEADASNVPLDIVSSVVPTNLAADYVKYLATGTHMFVGKMGAEMELRDSISNERLGAAVFVRTGEKMDFSADTVNKWGDVHEASLQCAEILRLRFEQARNGTLKQVFD